MGAVAEGKVLTVLASTKISIFAAFGGQSLGLKAGAGMGAITMGLVLGTTTGTQMVGLTFGQRQLDRFIGGYNGMFAHCCSWQIGMRIWVEKKDDGEFSLSGFYRFSVYNIFVAG
jgi:hypothetical protein